MVGDESLILIIYFTPYILSQISLKHNAKHIQADQMFSLRETIKF